MQSRTCTRICALIASTTAALGFVTTVTAVSAVAQEDQKAAVRTLIENHGKMIKKDAQLIRSAFGDGKTSKITRNGISLTAHLLPRLKIAQHGDNAMVLVEYRCSGRLFGLASYERMSKPKYVGPISDLKGFIIRSSEIPDIKAQWLQYRRSVDYKFVSELNGVVIKEFLYKIKRSTLGLAYGAGTEDPRFYRYSRHFVSYPDKRKQYWLPAETGDQELTKAEATPAQQKIIALFERYRVYGSLVYDLAICAADGKHDPKAVRRAVIEDEDSKGLTRWLGMLAAL